MSSLYLPERVRHQRPDHPSRSFPAHRAWVRRHHCCVPGCKRLPIECAHVRTGTDGGTSLKPSDRWCISLCSFHHAEQHHIGERRFETRHDISLAELAELFAIRSPHWRSLSNPTCKGEK
jgi:hypothetical protein